ncbi:MAG: hypothetical protein NVSMB4_01520 [Acidimicrobiales bacterium]
MTQTTPPERTVVAVHGPAIRAIRNFHGIRTDDFATTLGVTRAYVTKLELGYSRHVSPALYRKILTALSVKDWKALLADPWAAPAMPESVAS